MNARNPFELLARIRANSCFSARTNLLFSGSSALPLINSQLTGNARLGPIFTSFIFNHLRTLLHSFPASHLFTVCSPKQWGVYPKFIGLVKDGGPKASATKDKPYAQRAAREINCDNDAEHRGLDERGKRMDEQDFRRKSDAELETLKRRLLELGDEHGFEVEGSGERLELLFETETESGEPGEVRFVISPNTAARQIWISAL